MNAPNRLQGGRQALLSGVDAEPPRAAPIMLARSNGAITWVPRVGGRGVRCWRLRGRADQGSTIVSASRRSMGGTSLRRAALAAARSAQGVAHSSHRTFHVLTRRRLLQGGSSLTWRGM